MKKTRPERNTNWARERASTLWAQVDALESCIGGHWRARAHRRLVVDRLIREAARYDRIAAALDWPDIEEDVLPF